MIKTTLTRAPVPSLTPSAPLWQRSALPLATNGTQELQAKPSETKSRKPIGFVQPEEDDEKK
jgi:hypothetical protein